MSHHPDDVIVISSSSPPDTDLSYQFIQPTGEHVLHLISHLDHKNAKCTRLISANLLKMQVVQESIEAAPKCPAYSLTVTTLVSTENGL